MFDPRASKPVPAPIPAFGIYVLESHHARDFRMPVTAHDFLKVMYVLGGSGRVTAGRAEWPLRAGDVSIVEEGFAHRIEDDPDHALALLVLCIKARVVKTAPDADPGFRACRIFRNPSLCHEARSAMRRLLFEQATARPGYAAAMIGVTLQMLASLGRAQHSKSPHASSDEANLAGPLARVQAYVRTLEREFWVDEKLDGVAERLGLSRRHFTQLFRKAAGCSWLEHLRALRLQHAQHLLRTTERSIPMVAFECGFDDLSTFYRAFKTATGQAPGEWRNKR